MERKKLKLNKLPFTKTIFGKAIDIGKICGVENTKEKRYIVVIFGRKYGQGGCTPINHRALYLVYKKDLKKLFKEGYVELYFLCAETNWIEVGK